MNLYVVVEWNMEDCEFIDLAYFLDGAKAEEYADEYNENQLQQRCSMYAAKISVRRITE